jgi:hypothetical protein
MAVNIMSHQYILEKMGITCEVNINSVKTMAAKRSNGLKIFFRQNLITKDHPIINH